MCGCGSSPPAEVDGRGETLAPPTWHETLMPTRDPGDEGRKPHHTIPWLWPSVLMSASSPRLTVVDHSNGVILQTHEFAPPPGNGNPHTTTGRTPGDVEVALDRVVAKGKRETGLEPAEVRVCGKRFLAQVA
jgi:hypothetical protein